MGCTATLQLPPTLLGSPAFCPKVIGFVVVEKTDAEIFRGRSRIDFCPINDTYEAFSVRNLLL